MYRHCHGRGKSHVLEGVSAEFAELLPYRHEFIESIDLFPWRRLRWFNYIDIEN